jgi:ATP-binding cassette, subfamily B, bacterial
VSVESDELVDDAVDTPPWSTLETLQRGWRASPDLRKGFGTTVLLAAIGAAGRLVLPVLVQQAVDRGIRAPASGGATVNIGLVATLCAIGAVAVIVAQLCARAAVVRLGRRSEMALYRLRCDVFGHIHQLSVGQQAEFRKGALVSRVISDTDTLSQFLSWGGLAWLLDGALMIATAVAMFVYDPLLAAIVLIATAPLFFLLRGLQHRLVTAYGAVREANAGYLTALSELVSGAAVVRAYDAADARIAITNERADRLKKSGVRAGLWSALLFPTGEIFSSPAARAPGSHRVRWWGSFSSRTAFWNLSPSSPRFSIRRKRPSPDGVACSVCWRRKAMLSSPSKRWRSLRAHPHSRSTR